MDLGANERKRKAEGFLTEKDLVTCVPPISHANHITLNSPDYKTESWMLTATEFWLLLHTYRGRDKNKITL